MQAHCRYSSHGLLVATLCVEIIDYILGFSSIPTLLRLQATSTAHYVLVRKHIYRRSRLLVRPFVTEPENLFLVLKLSRAAISGSSALRFMLPYMSQDWTCKDLDIYTPQIESEVVVNFFLLEGYKVAKMAKAKPPYRPGMFDVTTMIKGARSIDVVMMPHTSFFTTISRFHLSCLINFLSADGFFSAYPTLTNAEYSLVSHLAFTGNGDTSPRDTTVEAYRKYQRRGFKLLHLPKTVNLPRSEDTAPMHSCGVSVWCPHTPRTTNDPHCLYVPFEANPTSVTYDRPSNRGLYGCGFGTLWILGGPSCDGTYNTLSPFTSTFSNVLA